MSLTIEKLEKIIECCKQTPDTNKCIKEHLAIYMNCPRCRGDKELQRDGINYIYKYGRRYKY